MLHVDMPSGNSAELRDTLKARDKFAVQSAVRLSLDTTTGLQETPGGIINDMRNALLVRLIESWTYSSSGTPLPSVNPAVLDDMDFDDYEALSQAVEPLLQKVVGANPNRGTSSEPSTSS